MTKFIDTEGLAKLDEQFQREAHPMTRAPDSEGAVGEVPEREGPAPIVTVSKPACDGCIHLQTEWWKDYLDNDETDSGTSARCGAVPTEHGGKSITAYWSKGRAAPDWCPFLARLPAAAVAAVEGEG